MATEELGKGTWKSRIFTGYTYTVSFIELKNYPLSAKTYLAKEIGLSIKARTRKNTADYISETELSELRQIKELSDRAMEFISK